MEQKPKLTHFDELLAPLLLVRVLKLDLQQPQPYLSSGTTAHRYAALILAGYSYTDAAKVLGITVRMSQYLRRDLRAQALKYFNEPTSYELAARFALDHHFRWVCLELHSGFVNAKSNCSDPLPNTEIQP